MYLLVFAHWIKKSIWSFWIKNLIAVHNSDEVLGVREVDDVVGVTWKHDDALDLITRNFVFKDWCIEISFVTHLNQSMTADYDELFPLSVVPVFPLSDSWFRDVDTDLTTIESVNKIGEGATVIYVHLEIEDGLVLM